MDAYTGSVDNGRIWLTYPFIIDKSSDDDHPYQTLLTECRKRAGTSSIHDWARAVRANAEPVDVGEPLFERFAGDEQGLRKKLSRGDKPMPIWLLAKQSYSDDLLQEAKEFLAPPPGREISGCIGFEATTEFLGFLAGTLNVEANLRLPLRDAAQRRLANVTDPSLDAKCVRITIKGLRALLTPQRVLLLTLELDVDSLLDPDGKRIGKGVPLGAFAELLHEISNRRGKPLSYPTTDETRPDQVKGRRTPGIALDRLAHALAQQLLPAVSPYRFNRAFAFTAVKMADAADIDPQDVRRSTLRLAKRYTSDYDLDDAWVDQRVQPMFKGIASAVEPEGCAYVVQADGLHIYDDLITGRMPRAHLPIYLLALHEFVFLDEVATRARAETQSTGEYRKSRRTAEAARDHLAELERWIADFRIHHAFATIAELDQYNRLYSSARHALGTEQVLATFDANLNRLRGIREQEHNGFIERRFRIVSTLIAAISAFLITLHVAEPFIAVIHDEKIEKLSLRLQVEPENPKAKAQHNIDEFDRLLDQKRHDEERIMEIAALFALIAALLTWKKLLPEIKGD